MTNTMTANSNLAALNFEALDLDQLDNINGGWLIKRNTIRTISILNFLV